MTRCRLLVIAKAPVPGRVKTRLCPPCRPRQAARVAAASLADTLAAGGAAPFDDRVLLLDGDHPVPVGWRAVPQRGNGLAERLANGYVDSAFPDYASLLIGMDTPQVTPSLLADAGRRLASGEADSLLGLAEDGGWWALGLRTAGHAAGLRDVPMSTPDTGMATLRALRQCGLHPAPLPMLRDVDTAVDAHHVAALCPPQSAFARAVCAHVPALVQP